eukprot:Pgem_evm4s17142
MGDNASEYFKKSIDTVMKASALLGPIAEVMIAVIGTVGIFQPVKPDKVMMALEEIMQSID